MSQRSPLESLIAESRRLAPESPEVKRREWLRLVRTSRGLSAAALPDATEKTFAPGLRGWWPLASALALSLLALGVAIERQGKRAPPRVAPPPSLRMAGAEPGWEQLDLGRLGQVSRRPGSRLTLPAADAAPGTAPHITLANGEFCAQINHRAPDREPPLLVFAPGATVAVIGTHFCVETDAKRTTVSVQEGRVRVTFADGRQTSIGVGESVVANVELPLPPNRELESRPTRVPPSQLAPAVAVEGDSSPLRENVDNTIGRENELFGLATAAEGRGDTASAIELLEDYQRLFPDGVFAPEARAGIRRLSGH